LWNVIKSFLRAEAERSVLKLALELDIYFTWDVVVISRGDEMCSDDDNNPD